MLTVPIREMLLTSKAVRPGKVIKPTHLVIHWTANEGKGADAEANAKYFARATRAASAHYIVDDAEVIRCIPENEMAYHVGAKQYTEWAKTHLGASPNGKTIGIEMCVNADGSFWQMYSNTCRLAAEILQRHGWGTDRLIRHYDVTGKNCPAFFVESGYAVKYIGKNPDEAWEMFKRNVNKFL